MKAKDARKENIIFPIYNKSTGSSVIKLVPSNQYLPTGWPPMYDSALGFTESSSHFTTSPLPDLPTPYVVESKISSSGRSVLI